MDTRKSDAKNDKIVTVDLAELREIEEKSEPAVAKNAPRATPDAPEQDE